MVKEIGNKNNEMITHELAMCNEWLIANNNKPKATLNDNKISMPFIKGAYPNNKETENAIVSMFEKGFMMADPDSKNFIVDINGIVHPVDFGLVLKLNKLDDIGESLATCIVSDYVKGGGAKRSRKQ